MLPFFPQNTKKLYHITHFDPMLPCCWTGKIYCFDQSAVQIGSNDNLDSLQFV